MRLEMAAAIQRLRVRELTVKLSRNAGGLTVALSVSVFGFLVAFAAAVSDPVETAALLAFKAGITDPNNTLESWTGDDPCKDSDSNSWRGIHCENINGGGDHVTLITLPHFGLGGKLAPELGNLTQLLVLNLKFNNIEGNIPVSFSRLTNLKRLLVNNNKFSGELAPELGSLSELQRFQIDSNGFSGTIPATFGNLTKCKHFHFTNNSFTGPIPRDLGRLPNLLHLLLDFNQLNGPLPSELANCQSLSTIQVDNNPLNTWIPTTWGQIPSLYKLSLANCGLNGTVPDLTNLWNLTYLDLSNNSLTGPLPDNLSSSTLNINLANNKLSGLIPDKYGALNNLQAMYLQNNNLSGNVPASLGNGNTFKDNSTEVVINLERNQLAALTSPALPNAAAQNFTQVWLAGNPLCNLLNAVYTTSLHCFEYSNKTATTTTQTSSDSQPGCNSTTFICHLPSSIAPNSPTCSCAEPVRLVIELISPAFAFLGSDVTGDYKDLVTDICYFPNDSNVVLLSQYWLSLPTRLRTTVQLFPVDGPRWSQEDVNVLSRNLTNYLSLSAGDEMEREYLIIGPYEILSISTATGDTSKTALNGGAVAGIAIGSFVGAVAMTAALLLICLHRRGHLVPAAVGKHLRAARNSKPSRLKVSGVRSFSILEMATATNNFKDEIGEGSYGKVYKGMLKDGSFVAIKRARREGQMQGSDSFYVEIELLSRVHHVNLVNLIGYCDDAGEEMLVYEFMPGGTLRSHLNATEVLHLVTRMRIALATARGLLYLHNDAEPRIIHRDIKANNILLDDHFNAKVADFGLSRLAPLRDLTGSGTDVKHHVSTLVKGTPGYLDPEYFLTQKLTEKSDVYSFGVVLMELITGLHPIYQGKNLAKEVMSAYDEGRWEEMVDPHMPSGGYNPKAMEQLVTLAIRCCRHDQDSRPNMSEATRTLDDIARLMEPWSLSMQPKSSTPTTSSPHGSGSIFSSGTASAASTSTSDYPEHAFHTNIFATNSSLILQGGR